MDNDKAFSIFAVTLVAGVLSVMTASVLAGYTTVPSPLLFAEHLFFTVGFRTAYKSLDGPGWPFLPGSHEVADEAAEAIPASGHHAGALG